MASKVEDSESGSCDNNDASEVKRWLKSLQSQYMGRYEHDPGGFQDIWEERIIAKISPLIGSSSHPPRLQHFGPLDERRFVAERSCQLLARNRATTNDPYWNALAGATLGDDLRCEVLKMAFPARLPLEPGAQMKEIFCLACRAFTPLRRLEEVVRLTNIDIIWRRLSQEEINAFEEELDGWSQIVRGGAVRILLPDSSSFGAEIVFAHNESTIEYGGYY